MKLTPAVKVSRRIAEIGREGWEACAGNPDYQANPFMSFDFLDIAEESGCAVERQGWGPQHLSVEDESGAVAAVHESVKEGETITAPLKAARVFPAMVVGMVDVGEQTGALPEMLLKIADTYDDEVDNAVAGMTSLLEPIMLVLLAIVVGGIVIAMFLPIIDLLNGGMEKQGEI